MIGKVYVSTFKFYDTKNQCMGFKKRPVLIVGKADAADYIILPISRVTNTANLDVEYDYKIEPNDVPLMNLSQVSYVRTHKQSVVHTGELTTEIVDFRAEYPEKYLDIICKMEEFQKSIINNAI